MESPMNEASITSPAGTRPEPILEEGTQQTVGPVAGQPVKTDPHDRRTQLLNLLARIQVNGAQSHEPEIDRLRTVNGLSDTEREIVLEIFRFGYEAAESERREDKMWAYQRLLRRLLRHEPLDQPIPLITPSPETGRETPVIPVTRSGERQTQRQASAPQRDGKQPLRRRVIKYGLCMGGATALLWTAVAGRHLIGDWNLYPPAPNNPQVGINAPSQSPHAIDPVTPVDELAEPEEPDPSRERGSANLSPAAPGNYDSTATAATESAGADDSLQSTRSKPPSKIQKENISVGVETKKREAQTTNKDSPTVYHTLRQILLREEPYFGSASRIMLDAGARLNILEVNGSWLKVRAEKSGAVGFVREEFVAPVKPVPGSVTSLNKARHAS